MCELKTKISEIASSSAKFYCVDLHLHSPSSYDWDNSGQGEYTRNPDLDKIPQAAPIEEINIKAYRQLITTSKRELVAITDHNITRFGAVISSGSTSTDPVFIPGIELCVSFSDAPLIRDLRIHVLGIFPEGTQSEAIARILPPGTQSEAERNPRDILTYPNIDTLIDLIHREKGLAIAAHIESANGLRGVYKNTTELMLETIDGTPEANEVLRRLGDQVKDELVKFDAIQVKPSTDSIHYVGPSGDLRIPLIVSSDTHKGAELNLQQTNKYSYIKMAKPSFAALNDALKYPDLRVRFETNLPESQPPRLLGLRLFGNKVTDKTFFKDTVLGFSDNLTCIIGPRGSGKSAAIDALRYLMGYSRAESLKQIDKVAKQVTERQKYTLEKTRIEALYQAADGTEYRLVATYDSQEQYVTEVYSIDGTKLNIDDVGQSGEFPLRLFGWGELELLASNPETQRELLDRFIPEIESFKTNKGKQIIELKDNRRTCIDKAEELEDYFNDPEKDFKRLNEYKTKYTELNTQEIEVHFNKIDKLKSQRTTLKGIIEVLQKQYDDDDITSPLEISKLLEACETREWADELAARLKPKEIDDWIRKTCNDHKAMIKTSLDLVNSEDERLEQLVKEAEIEIQKVIGEEQAVSADLRNNAKARYEKALKNHNEYKEIYHDFTKLVENRKSILSKIKEYEDRIFATRNQEIENIQEKVSLVEDDNFKIKLLLEQRADKNLLLDGISSNGLITFSGQWRAQKRDCILADNFTAQSLAEGILGCDPASFKDISTTIDDKTYSFRESDAESLIKDNSPFQKVEGFDIFQIDPKKLENVFKIQEISVDDNFYITLGDKPIQFCSPGQRCSAMLPIVSLTSQAPLVIDQPEDNLDNKLVSKALFKILAKLKETRQIILATHNPNILVSGDAEQVLLLNANGDLEAHGSIDEPQIIDAVISLMEGGSEAFDRRHKKYEPYLKV